MNKKYIRRYEVRPHPVQVLPDPTHGRKNSAVWNSINWENTNHAIARHLGCDDRTVMHQRFRRGYPSYPRGGNHRTHPEYRPLTPLQRRHYGVEPLPERVVL